MGEMAINRIMREAYRDIFILGVNRTGDGFKRVNCLFLSSP